MCWGIIPNFPDRWRIPSVPVCVWGTLTTVLFCANTVSYPHPEDVSAFNTPTGLSVAVDQANPRSVTLKWFFVKPENFSLQEVQFFLRLESEGETPRKFYPHFDRAPLKFKFTQLTVSKLYTATVIARGPDFRNSDPAEIRFSTLGWPKPRMLSVNLTERDGSEYFMATWNITATPQLSLFKVNMCYAKEGCEEPVAKRRTDRSALLPVRYNDRFDLTVSAWYEDPPGQEFKTVSAVWRGEIGPMSAERLLTADFVSKEGSTLKFRYHPARAFGGTGSYYDIFVCSPSMKESKFGSFDAIVRKFNEAPAPPAGPLDRWESLLMDTEDVQNPYRDVFLKYDDPRARFVSLRRTAYTVRFRIAFGTAVTPAKSGTSSTNWSFDLGYDTDKLFDFSPNGTVHVFVRSCPIPTRTFSAACSRFRHFEVETFPVPSEVRNLEWHMHDKVNAWVTWSEPDDPRTPDGYSVSIDRGPPKERTHNRIVALAIQIKLYSRKKYKIGVSAYNERYFETSSGLGRTVEYVDGPALYVEPRGGEFSELKMPESLTIVHPSRFSAVFSWNFALPDDLLLSDVDFVVTLLPETTRLGIGPIRHGPFQWRARRIRFEHPPLQFIFENLIPEVVYVAKVRAMSEGFEESPEAETSFTARQTDWPAPMILGVEPSGTPNSSLYTVTWGKIGLPELLGYELQVCAQELCAEAVKLPVDASSFSVAIDLSERVTVNITAVYNLTQIEPIRRHSLWLLSKAETVIRTRLRRAVVEKIGSALKLERFPESEPEGPKAHYELFIYDSSSPSEGDGTHVLEKSASASRYASAPVGSDFQGRLKGGADLQPEGVFGFKESTEDDVEGRAPLRLVINSTHGAVHLRIVFSKKLYELSKADDTTPSLTKVPAKARSLVLGTDAAEMLGFPAHAKIIIALRSCETGGQRGALDCCGDFMDFDVLSDHVAESEPPGPETDASEPEKPSAVQELQWFFEDQVTTVKITWEEPAEPRGPIDGYIVKIRETDGIDFLESRVLTLDRTARSCLIEDFNYENEYVVEVCAYNLDSEHRRMLGEWARVSLDVGSFARAAAIIASRPKTFLMVATVLVILHAFYFTKCQ